MLVHSPDTVANKIVQEQIIPIILSAMSNEKADTDFKESVLGLIGNLSLNEKAKASIDRSDAISTLVETMRSCIEVDLKRAACSALGHIALDSSANQARISESGGLPATFAAIKAFPHDPDMLIAAFGLMKELAINDEEIAKCIVDEGGLTIILSAMKEHSDLSMMQIAACGVVAYLPYGKKDRMAPKIAEAVVSALKNHSRAADVETAACEALLEIVTNVPSARKLVKETKTRKLLLEAKEANEDCESDVDDILAI